MTWINPLSGINNQQLAIDRAFSEGEKAAILETEREAVVNE